MACATCGKSILFGGKKAGNRRYCSKQCYAADELGRMTDEVSESDVATLAESLQRSPCPSCGSQDGVEVFKSYFVYSVLILTSWKEKPAMTCRACAKKQQAKDLAASFFLGWWGIPFGLIVTPIIIVMNIVAMNRDLLPGTPSKELKQHARLLLAQKALLARQSV